MSTLLKRILASGRVQRAGGVLVHAAIRGWMGRAEAQVAYYDSTADIGRPEWARPHIYLVWHEYLLLPLYGRRQTGTSLLVGQHRDASVLSHAATLLGYRLFRGSSGRGGMNAVRRILTDRELRTLVITPDGPRGPRRKLAPGAVFLASRTGLPIVLCGAGADRPYRLRSWDRFVVPRLHSRVRFIMSPSITLPPDLNREQLESVRASLEASLDVLTTAAEEWAESGRAFQDAKAFESFPQVRGKYR